MWWHTVTHGRGSEEETGECSVSSITTAEVHTSAVSSRLNWRPPADLNGLVRFARKTKSGFWTCDIAFQLASNILFTADSTWIAEEPKRRLDRVSQSVEWKVDDASGKGRDLSHLLASTLALVPCQRLINLLMPIDDYSGRGAPLTSKRFIFIQHI